jgi:subtilase family serine protease
MAGSISYAFLCCALLSITIVLHGCGGGGDGGTTTTTTRGGDGGTTTTTTTTACLAEGTITPCVLRNFYKLPGVAAADSKEAMALEKTTQAVFGSLNQHWSASDRRAFQTLYDLPLRHVTELDSHDMESDTWCVESPDDCGEANLDVQYMLAMSPWSHMGFYYVDSDTSFTDWIEQVANLDNPPDVFSISYGMIECGASSDQKETFNNQAMKLGVRGVTIIASSGDDGANGRASCDDDGDCQGWQVNWPASSPYVTGVGATQGVETGSEEVACQVACVSPPEDTVCTSTDDTARITSGGGYSTFDVPDWQKDTPGFSGSGRGVPDVSLAGHMYGVVVGGTLGYYDGTSASAPAFGGIVSQINARRIAENKPTVGFINPVMYKSPSAFNDITSGDNKCGRCARDDECTCCGGYEAGNGWDPVTGLGSVDFKKFEALFDAASVGQTAEPMTARKQVKNATKGASPLRKTKSRHLGWTKMDRAPPDMLHRVVFAVKEKNIDQLEQELLDRSTPQSPKYGKWLSGDEVRKLTFNEKAVQTVRQALVKAGAKSLTTSLGGEFVSAVAPIRIWEQLLQCEFHLHERSVKKGTYIAANAYSLPLELQDHLLGVLRVLEISPVVDHSKAAVNSDMVTV